MSLPIFIVGGGGHAKVLIEALRTSGLKVMGITDADPAKRGKIILGIPVLGNDDELKQHAPDKVLLVNGIGSAHIPKARTALFDSFKRKGFTFASVVHSSAVVASDTVLGEGVQVMAGAVIQPGSMIGANAIINTNATVDHDCRIGNHVHLSSGATLSGSVRVDAGTHIGTGATVIQGIVIGKNCLVAAGAVVVSDVMDGTTVAGVPAKEIGQ